MKRRLFVQSLAASVAALSGKLFGKGTDSRSPEIAEWVLVTDDWDRCVNSEPLDEAMYAAVGKMTMIASCVRRAQLMRFDKSLGGYGRVSLSRLCDMTKGDVICLDIQKANGFRDLGRLALLAAEKHEFGGLPTVIDAVFDVIDHDRRSSTTTHQWHMMFTEDDGGDRDEPKLTRKPAYYGGAYLA